MRRLLTISLSVLLFLHAAILTAQEKSVYLKSYHAVDGLSDNNVTCIVQDKYGFIWIGTKDGLNRFDGKEFQVFRNDPKDSVSLSSNNITCLEISNDSILWIGTANAGFCSYDFKSGHFRRFTIESAGLLSNYVNSLSFDQRKSGLWVGQNNGGLSFLDFKTNRAKTLIDNKTYFDIAVMDDHVYAAAIGRSIRRIQKLDLYDSSTAKYASTVNTIFRSDDGKIWCGAWDNGLHLFDGVTRKASYIFDNNGRLSYNGDEILSIAEDEQQLLWLGTRMSGLRFFDMKSRTFIPPFRFSEEVSGRVNSLFKDKNNRIWIGSAAGLYLYDPLLNQFNVVMLNDDRSDVDCPVNGRLITKSGLDLVISPCGLYFKHKQENRYSFKSFVEDSIKLQLVSIFKTSSNRILIGTNKTVYFLDTVNIALSPITKINGNFKNHFHSIYSSRFNAMSPLRKENDSMIFIVAYGHEMFLFNRNTEQVINIGFGKDSISDIYIDNLIRKIVVDKRNRIFLCGASRGLQQFFIKEQFRFDNYFYNDSLKFIKECSWRTYAKLDENTINDIFDMTELSDGSYYATSQGNGLLRFHPDDIDRPFVTMNAPVKSTMGISAVSDSSIWMITSKGILNYNINTGRYILYSELHGLPSGMTGYFYKDKDGQLTAGFGNGFVSFYPERIKAHAEKPTLYLTKYWVMDELQKEKISRELVMKHDRNFVRFYLSSNCFSFNEQNEYRYFLEGIDQQWRSNGSDPLITYTNLPPGDYTFRCMVLNSSGIASDQLNILITIIPPFYTTWWFYLLIAGFIAVLIYAMYRYRLLQILKLQNIRNHIARDLHDDIGSTLGSIQIYSQVAKVKLNGEASETIGPILKKIEDNAKEIIEKTSDTVWFVKSSNDSFHELFIRMESHIAGLLQHSPIRFNIVADPTLFTLKLDMTSKRNLFLIFKEALHNMVKYSNATEVEVKLEVRNSKYRLVIRDNGEGFDRSKYSNPLNGNGLANMENRASEMKGNLRIDAAPGKGTVIVVEF
ncbi:MAG: hypothetical protein IPJ86_16360 [Bacteroidetes bacterium]|nr:hypothetical protein [Bacteroidota bacterium]